MKKHIVCLGDSNTHGYCADPSDCADGGSRFNESERWTCLLQQALGEDCLVLEEGLGGRTTVFVDALHESMDAVGVAYPILMSHEPVDLLVIMLGTNDTKERFAANAAAIAVGMERLIQKCQCTPCWGEKGPNILIVCPPPLGAGFHDEVMGKGCVEKSVALPPYMKAVAERNGCAYFDAKDCEMNPVDFTHLTKKGHAQLAEALAALVPTLL
ncbi:MAG: lipolytic enzyme, G-D-S-L [Oscillospiraceae bacterium]|nr:lipolytic enzyme, G-D-S-L [Oscillospiraceae bacterium]